VLVGVEVRRVNAVPQPHVGLVREEVHGGGGGLQVGLVVVRVRRLH
jgi:hypothetical protein